MLRPTNNLRQHREWALSKNEFKPVSSGARPATVKNSVPQNKENSLQSPHAHVTNLLSSPAQSKEQKSNSAPAKFTLSDIEWTDDEIELLCESQVTHEAPMNVSVVSKSPPSNSYQQPNKSQENDIDVIEVSSGYYPPANNSIPTSDSIEFHVSQAPFGSDFEMPKPEIGSLFTEKIALLEQKVSRLTSRLQQNNISLQTDDLDRKLHEVESRIERFVNQADEVIDLQEPYQLEEPRNGFQEIDKFPNKASMSEESFPIYIDHIESQDDIISFQRSEEIESVLHPISTTKTSPYFQNGTSTQREYNAKQLEHSKYPWSKEVSQILLTKFGLNGFRANQAEAIDATLAGKDVVVLMPTGGGKSLCYQLPALVTSGKTKGTTVVISPLISLMQDQVYHLKNRNIHAETISSQLSGLERSEIYRKLESGELQLLYVSPEMSVSGAMKGALKKLYNSGKLARIIIDEAHCVSAWGHDFRPDYMKLSSLKFEFILTPIMALTATANDRVLLDIVSCLRTNSLVLKQSFNRKNLFYEVCPKTTNVMNDITTICKSYRGQTGIVYCNSKNDCEETAADLKRQGIKADFYHAGMTQLNRTQVQDKWQRGECKVVCATIAFGMGIDKPDVRFVIHHSLPRTMEGYYQETGRAGRDGLRSQCYLFFNYKDASRMRWQIQNDKDTSFEYRENVRSLFDRVVQYCANNTDCRRKQVLQYFNEKFNPVLCREQCDNCRNLKGKVIVTKDMTEDAKIVATSVKQMGSLQITLQQCLDFLFGRKNRKMKDTGLSELPTFGMLKDRGLTELERLVHDLCSKNVLEEYSVVIRGRYPQAYLKLGPNHNLLIKGQMPILLTLAVDPDTGQKRPGNGAKTFTKSKRTKA